MTVRGDDSDVKLDEIRAKVNAFWKRRILVFVKRFNGAGQREFINGWIVEEPTSEFFLIEDIGEPERTPPKMVFFSELVEPDTILAQSQKIPAVISEEVKKDVA